MTSKDGAPKSAYKLFKFRLFIGCLAIFLISLGTAVWKVNADYNAAIQTTVSQTSNLVRAIEAHVVSDIDKINAPLDAVALTIATRKADGNLTQADIKSILTSPLLPSTADYWILFINSDGIGVAASKELHVAGVSYNDRDYFIAQKNHSNGRTFVGEPQIGKVSKTRNFFLSKRVEDASGEFIGVIVAVVESTPLVRVLEHFLYDESLSTTVVSNLGKIIARVPLFEESFGIDISKTNLFFNSAKSPSGTYHSISAVDKKLRIYSYRVFERYPLTITVGMISPLLIDILLKDALGVIGGLLALLLVLIYGSKFALKSFRNIEAFANRQQQLNYDLDIAHKEIEATSRRARMIADNIPAQVAYIDSEQRYQFRNSFYRYILSVDYERMIGRTILEVQGPEKYATVENEVARALKGESLVFERGLSEGGQTIYLRYQFSPDKNEDGTVAGFYALISNVTDMKEIQHELMALSRVDELTGLPNRTAIYERLNEAISRTARGNHAATSSRMIGCLFLDIDRFKSINDTYGHSCGDAVLKEFGRRLEAGIRQSDMAARLAGDEFVILLEGLEDESGAISVAKKIISSMAAPFVTEYGNLIVTASIGIALSCKANETPEGLLKEADNALYKAKKKGRNTFAVKNCTD